MQQFQEPPRDRMTDTEAQEVLRLLAERREAKETSDSLPSIHDVAVLANASPDDVSSALAEVRAKAYVGAITPPVKKESAERKIVLLGATFCVMMLLAFFMLIRLKAVKETSTSEAPAATMSGPTESTAAAGTPVAAEKTSDR
jgi:hypothetical protein